MSSQKGNMKKHGGQNYQNQFKFKHNPNSDKTDKIKQAPLDFLCPRCYDQLKWRIEYRKYKPLTTPSKCNLCLERTIIKAYRTICDNCARKHKYCTKCAKHPGDDGYRDPEITDEKQKELSKKLDKEMEECLESLKERSKRTVLRKINAGEVTYDQAKKIFIYKDTNEEYKTQGKDGIDDDECDEDEEEEDGDDDSQKQNSDHEIEEVKKQQANKDEIQKKPQRQNKPKEEKKESKKKSKKEDDGDWEDDSDEEIAEKQDQKQEQKQEQQQ